MPLFAVTVRNRTVTVHSPPPVVCGNAGYALLFSFDAEWPEDADRLLLLQYESGGRLCEETAAFTGNLVSLPPLRNTRSLRFTVSDGVRAALPCRLVCRPCITGIAAREAEDSPDFFAQVMETLSPDGAYSLLTPALLAKDGLPLLTNAGKQILCRRDFT